MLKTYPFKSAVVIFRLLPDNTPLGKLIVVPEFEGVKIVSVVGSKSMIFISIFDELNVLV